MSESAQSPIMMMVPAATARIPTRLEKSAREAGCAVEISSAGLRKPVAEAYPEARLLARLVGAGVPVTFSSDAHAPAEVGWGFDRTLALARAAGAREFVTMEHRQKKPQPLPEP